MSYSAWFNRRRNRAGHLFQGRFKALVVEDDAGWQEVARYVHLNPVRVAGLGLGKAQRQAARLGLACRPEAEVVSERLRLLREYRWSSYRAYAGYGAALAWVWPEPLARLCGGRAEQERRAALRAYTERPVRQGGVEGPWGRLVAGLVLGSQAFAERLRREAKGNAREQAQLKTLVPGVSWPRIVEVLERLKGESWERFSNQHGDWGRDAAMWLGRKQGRLSLRELGALVGGADYAAVGQALSRFGKRLERDAKLRGQVRQMEAQLSNVEM